MTGKRLSLCEQSLVLLFFTDSIKLLGPISKSRRNVTIKNQHLAKLTHTNVLTFFPDVVFTLKRGVEAPHTLLFFFHIIWNFPLDSPIKRLYCIV